MFILLLPPRFADENPRIIRIYLLRYNFFFFYVYNMYPFRFNDQKLEYYIQKSSLYLLKYLRTDFAC